MQHVEITPGETTTITLPDGREVRVGVSRFSYDRKGNVQAHLSIDAPRSVPIFRSELLTQEWRRALS